MDTNSQSFDIREGMDIVASDGDTIGRVDSFEGDNIIVSGGIFSEDTSIPVSAVASADADRAYLGVTRSAAMSGQWTIETAASYGTTGASYASSTTTGTEKNDSQPTHVNETDDIKVELAEEELSAQKRAVERGEVRIDKTVVAEEQTIDVPVTEERVNVSRRAVDRDVTAGDNVFEGGTIDVPVRGEEVDVRKDARVREEVEISKDAVQETERVTDTVRREEVQIDETGTTDSSRRRGNKR